jgi:adenylate cyclase
MYPAAGGNSRTKVRLAKRSAPVGILRGWRRVSGTRNAAGETRTLSFLVCRMREFRGLVASYAGDAEGLCRFVRHSTTVFAGAVQAHGGTVDRMFSGGFSAFFDGPSEGAYHAVKACESAAAMLAAADDLNRQITRPSVRLRIGIGLSTGSAIFGDFGTDDEPHYAVVGGPVDTAHALERLSAAYGAEILASHATWRAADRSFAFLEVDQFADAGGKALPICALLGPPLSRAHPKFLALKSFHGHIFDAFRARDWNQARTLVAQCRVLSEANPVLYDFYLDRITHYEANPPPSDWSGTLMPPAS